MGAGNPETAEEINMNNRKILYLIPATAIVVIVMAAVSMFYRNAQAGNTEAEITKEEARKIVLYDSGAKAEDVTFTKEKLDMESGILTYEMDFYTGEKSYEYELNAQTGSIREKEVTSRKTTTEKKAEKKTGEEKTVEKSKQAGTDEVIGVEKAQEIVLKKAGLKSSQVAFSKCNLDTDDGIMVYEIEFRYDGKEYDYDVDACNGKILESDISVVEVKDTDIDDRTDDSDHDEDHDDDNDNDDDHDDYDDKDDDNDKDDDDDDHDDDHDEED